MTFTAGSYIHRVVNMYNRQTVFALWLYFEMTHLMPCYRVLTLGRRV